MPLFARKTIKLGPVRLHFTQDGFASYSLKVGPWSWNSRTRRQRVDLPGPWSWTSPPPPRRRKPAQRKPKPPSHGSVSRPSQ